MVVARYPLDPDGGWTFHAASVEREIARLAAAETRVRAVVLVNPNNPTGSGVPRGELLDLLALAREHDFAVVSDEVFLDYRFAETPDDVPVAAALAAEGGGLVFSLGGLSKSAALPQLKLGWMLVGGPDELLHETLPRLEWIADAYLSVGTPVQLALPELLRWGEGTAAAIRARVTLNHRALARAFPPGGAVAAEPLRGGWSAVLRVPSVEPEEELVLRLLHDHDLLVHPGYFFEFPVEAFLVLSLLPPPDVFVEGVARLARGLSVDDPLRSAPFPVGSLRLQIRRADEPRMVEALVDAGQASHLRTGQERVKTSRRDPVADAADVSVRRLPSLRVEARQVHGPRERAEGPFAGRAVVVLEVAQGEVANGAVDGGSVAQPGVVRLRDGPPRPPAPAVRRREKGENVVRVPDRPELNHERRPSVEAEGSGREDGTLATVGDPVAEDGAW